MNQATKQAKPTAAERNEKVRGVLAKATRPMSPSEIATQIREPWCYDGYPSTSAISPVCKRIGATSEKGKWTLKADGA